MHQSQAILQSHDHARRDTPAVRGRSIGVLISHILYVTLFYLPWYFMLRPSCALLLSFGAREHRNFENIVNITCTHCRGTGASTVGTGTGTGPSVEYCERHEGAHEGRQGEAQRVASWAITGGVWMRQRLEWSLIVHSVLSSSWSYHDSF